MINACVLQGLKGRAFDRNVITCCQTTPALQCVKMINERKVTHLGREYVSCGRNKRFS